MAYPHEFYKVTFGGEVFGGEDIWSCGLNFGFPGKGVGFGNRDWPDVIENISETLSTWYRDPNTRISSSATLKWVKVAFIGEDGLYFREPVVYDYSAPIAGGRVGAVPAQLALAVSFLSSKMRAPGKDARIYLPMPNLSPEADGGISSSEAGNIGANFAAVIRAIELHLQQTSEDAPQMIVASQKTESHNVVQTVRVGRLIDTQRRRRNKMSEEYAPSTIIVR